MDITAINHFVCITLVIVGTSSLFAVITAINHFVYIKSNLLTAINQFVYIKPVSLTAVNHIWLNIPNLWNLISILGIG